MWHLTCATWHMTCDTWHVTYDTSWGVNKWVKTSTLQITFLNCIKASAPTRTLLPNFQRQFLSDKLFYIKIRSGNTFNSIFGPLSAQINVWFSAQKQQYLKYFFLTTNALLLDTQRTSPWPRWTFPSPPTHFSLTWRAYFSNWKKTNKCWRTITILFGKNQ